MGQLAKLKRVWNLAPVSQIVQKDTENYCTCLSINWPSLVTSWFVVQKIYSKMHLVSCTNTHLKVTDLINHGMVKKTWKIWISENTKTWISWERNIIFLQNKKILNLCFRCHILRIYRFVVEVTFKRLTRMTISAEKVIVFLNRSRVLVTSSTERDKKWSW